MAVLFLGQSRWEMVSNMLLKAKWLEPKYFRGSVFLNIPTVAQLVFPYGRNWEDTHPLCLSRHLNPEQPTELTVYPNSS